MHSHAQVPTVLVKEDRYRVYIATRPKQTLSLTTYVDVALDDPTRVLRVHDQPLLQPGKPGTFDEFGVMPSSVIAVGDLVYLYTTGWMRGHTVPYLNAVGLAVSRDGGHSFERMFEGPVVDRTAREPFSAMSPFVMRQGAAWHMWYSSGTGWFQGPEKVEPVYLIKYASSDDGIAWRQPNITCIPGKTPEEANTRPAVVFDRGAYHMWFSYRGSRDFRGGAGSYRIGYARSTDAKAWTRDDSKAGIEAAATGWDSGSVAYPYVVEGPKGRVMFYNGTDFGRGGFGVATWTE